MLTAKEARDIANFDEDAKINKILLDITKRIKEKANQKGFFIEIIVHKDDLTRITSELQKLGYNVLKNEHDLNPIGLHINWNEKVKL